MVSAGRLLPIISVCLMIVACIFYIVSNAIPRWGFAQSESEAAVAHIGLWRVCISNATQTSCVNYPSTCAQQLPETLPACNKMMVARAFVTIACIISALSVPCLIACAIISTNLKRIIVVISKVLPFVSFIAGIIGVSVGVVFATPDLYYYQMREAAILGIIALAVNMIGALVALAIR